LLWAAIAFGSVLAGCSSVGSGQYRYTAHANLDMYEKAPSAAATQPKMYSPEWWAQERAREVREQERLSRDMRICRGC
jgi:hypothetical protein